MEKYRIKEGYEDADVCTSAPAYRCGDGRFVLSKCTQRDLKYLFEVAKHPAVELIEDEQAKKISK